MWIPSSSGSLVNKFLEFFTIEASDNPILFWVKEAVVALLILFAFWCLSRLVRRLVLVWASRFTAFTRTDLDDRILQRIAPPLELLFLLAGAYYAVRSLPLVEKIESIASGVIFVVNVTIIAFIAYRVADELLKWYATRVEERHGVFNRQLLPLVEKLISIFLVGTALIITLKHFNYDVLSLVTALGIGSLAIGMAAKDTLANMISGFTLMLDRPFRIGDRIQLTNGLWGDVVDIGLRSTKIKTVDNTYLIIPNSDLCNSTVVNLAFPDLRAKGRINIGVGYDSDIAKVKGILVETALEVPEVLREPVPEAFFTSFGDHALNTSLFFWVDDYSQVFSVTDKVNSLLLTRLQDNGIVIPYPIRTVQLEKDR